MSCETADDAAVILSGRAFFYELIHVLFSGEPNEALCDVLASKECRSTIDEVARLCPGVEPLSRMLQEEAPENAGQRAAALLSTYNRCIAGLGGKRTACPWETFYTSSRRLLMQPETLEVRNAYRAFGYLPEMYRKVADDHLSLECAFMALLARRTEVALHDFSIEPVEPVGSLAEGQRSFLENHLGKWITSYAQDLAEDAGGSLYSAAANALDAFVAWDIPFLEQLADAPVAN